MLIFSTLNQDHVTEDHADGWHMTKNTYVEEDYVNRQYVTWNFNSEDHVDSWHVTENITAKDHDDRHHVTNTTAAQQQPRDLRSVGKLNSINRQDHGMIDIEELLNDWLRKAV